MLEYIDTEHKIKIYEDDFFVETLSPMQCEVRERNLLAKQMGKGGWHIQLDADEYFVDFKSFVNYLKNKSHLLKEGKKGVNIRCFWIPLFKRTHQGYFYVNYKNKLPESIAIATNKPVYEYGRVNGHFNILSPFSILHDTWARTDGEVWQKIQNWGHKHDFDVQSYFDFWKSINKSNYTQVKNFHFIKPETWEFLGFIESKNIEELSQSNLLQSFKIPKWKLRFLNNKNVARVRALIDKILNLFKLLEKSPKKCEI